MRSLTSQSFLPKVAKSEELDEKGENEQKELAPCRRRLNPCPHSRPTQANQSTEAGYWRTDHKAKVTWVSFSNLANTSNQVTGV